MTEEPPPGVPPGPPDFTIRPFAPGDLDDLNLVCLRTAAAGGDASALVDDPLLFGAIWAAPYAVLEPEHCHVLADPEGRVVGYVLGTVDAVAFEERCERSWWPELRERHPLAADGERLDDLLIALIHHRPLPRWDLHDDFPAELHIDLLPEAQGQGWGRRLLEEFLAGLRRAGVAGVHLGVSVENTRATAFYRHLGFNEHDCDGVTRTFTMRL